MTEPSTTTHSINLCNQRVMNIDIWTCPLTNEQQIVLIDLWRTEWTRTDYGWIESMRGDYADTLTIQSIVGYIDGEPAGTASVCFARVQPEVATIGSVLTHARFRRLGVAEHLTNLATKLAIEAGCRTVYLGATRSPKCVYLKCGFQWHNGGVMRYVSNSHDTPERDFYAPGQQTTLRDAQWGDLPAFACLVTQPIDTVVLDYPRGLVSGKYVTLQRCVSNFPSVYNAVRDSDGVMCMLVGEVPNRVLGFGSVTPGQRPARRHTATLDLAVHDHYAANSSCLLDNLLGIADRLEIKCIESIIADADTHKRDLLKAAHFQPIARLSDKLMLQDQLASVQVWALKNQTAKNQHHRDPCG